MMRLFQFGVLLALLPVGLFAQGGYANFPDRMSGLFWKESDPVSECHNGTWHKTTYARFYLASGNSNIFIRDYDTGEPCDCTVGPVSLTSPQQTASVSFLLRPVQESNCKSGDTQGQPQTVPGQAAPGSMGGYGGSGPRIVRAHGIAEGPSPRDPPPPPDPPVQSLGNAPAPRLEARAAAAGSAFTYTLPFRALPSGPQLTDVTSEVAWACNASINPTMFRVYHVDNVVKRYNMCTGVSIAKIPVAEFSAPGSRHARRLPSHRDQL